MRKRGFPYVRGLKTIAPVTISLLAVIGLSVPGPVVAERSKPVSLVNPAAVAPKAGDAVDVAPFGELRTWNGGKDIGVLWEDSRDIFKVEMQFADASALPDPSTVKVQYWQERGKWPEDRIPRDKVTGSGGSGWREAGDWYNGNWRDADVEVSANGAVWVFTFKPINQKEFPDLSDFPATYRSTLKMRVLFPDTAPAVTAFHTYTDSKWAQTTAIVEWGGTARTAQDWSGKAEAFNGYIERVRRLGGSKITMTGTVEWTSVLKGETDGIVIAIWYATPAAVFSFDDTVVTIRAKQHSFSFLAKEIAEGKRIYVRDYGVVVKGARDGSSFDDIEKSYQSVEKSLYQQIGELPEQTLSQAWKDMPKKGRIYMPLAVEGGREHFRLDGDGNIGLDSRWQRRVHGADSERIKWGNSLNISFGIPREGAQSGTSLDEGALPVVTTWYEKDGIKYTEEAFATTLSGKLPKEGRVPAEEPQVLMVRLRLTNKDGTPKKTTLPIEVGANGLESVIQQDGLVSAKSGEGEMHSFYISGKDVKLTAQEKRALCEITLPPNGLADIYLAIPFETLSDAASLAQLKALKYDDQQRMISGYWRKRITQGCQVATPEPMINDFYAANITHQLINTDNEPGNNERAMAKVGTFGYGVYSNESVMMTSELDRRGHHDVARKALQTWIHYQGTAGLPGDYTTKDGVFYGSGGHQDGGYNQHHGWTLWGMAEHYWFTGDKAWLNRVAANLIKACDWVSNERRRTKTDECVGIRAIEYGLLPPGSLEDIGDWRCWMSNNVFSWWGMDNTAKALADINHPQAKRLLAEAAAYKQDIRKAFFEAMVRSPVVPLRDGSYIPTIPSDVHRRGRSFGWITETLEGSIHLLRCGMIAPDEPAAKWIMQDYEDNRYISDQFGYQITEGFDKLWFSLGGFSQQPSLLCSPTPYLLRDQPKHYLRAYFNAFAAGYFPEKAMLTEHPLPNLGDYRGDHFKSSDEAMNTSWVRWMFVWDEGKDLYLGKMMPRYWLADGKTVKITRAQTHFGEMSMSMRSYAAKGRIEMTIEPPTRRLPGATYARFRHPAGNSIKRVTVNGKPWKQFDPKKEWVVLPALKAKTVVVAYY